MQNGSTLDDGLIDSIISFKKYYEWWRVGVLSPVTKIVFVRGFPYSRWLSHGFGQGFIFGVNPTGCVSFLWSIKFHEHFIELF